MHPRRSLPLLGAALLLLLASCATSPASGSASAPPQAGAGASAPSAAVEQFLRLAGRKQYMEMGWVFGTAEGSILQRDPHPQVERRMYALASVLENSGFTIADESPIPGSVGQAMRLTVQVRKADRTYSVPFTTVRGPAQRWFVETVGIEAITAPR